MKLFQTNAFLLASCLSTAAATSACGFFAPSNTPSSTDSSEEQNPTSAAGDSAKPTDLAAFKLPLTIDLPAGADVESVGDDVNITVGESAVRVGLAYEEIDTVSKAKAHYSKDSPVEYVTEEANLLVWKIGGGQRGFLVLTQAQGKTYSCTGSGNTAEIEPAIARCKSIKPVTTQPEAQKADGKKAESKPVDLTAFKLPLSIDLPVGAELVQFDHRVTIHVGDSTLDVGPAEKWESTIAAAKATRDQNFATEYLKQEADLLLWKRDEKEQEFVVLAKHAGKTYSCRGSAPTAGIEAEIARCKSLKPAK